MLDSSYSIKLSMSKFYHLLVEPTISIDNPQQNYEKNPD